MPAGAGWEPSNLGICAVGCIIAARRVKRSEINRERTPFVRHVWPEESRVIVVLPSWVVEKDWPPVVRVVYPDPSLVVVDRPPPEIGMTNGWVQGA